MAAFLALPQARRELGGAWTACAALVRQQYAAVRAVETKRAAALRASVGSRAGQLADGLTEVKGGLADALRQLHAEAEALAESLRHAVDDEGLYRAVEPELS